MNKQVTVADFDDWFDEKYREKLAHRADTVAIALKYVLANKDPRHQITIIETGTTRKKDNWHGDGCMTLVAADFLTNFIPREGNTLLSVDIDQEAVDLANELLSDKEYPRHGWGRRIEVQCQDSIAFLEELEEWNPHIDLLILDSYDWTMEDYLGAQEHCLKEFIAAEPYLKRDSILLIDDVGLPYQGKGGLLIEYLHEKRDEWRLVASGYQYVYRRY